MTIDNDCKSCHFWDHENRRLAYTENGTQTVATCLNPKCPWVGEECSGGCKFWTKKETRESQT